MSSTETILLQVLQEIQSLKAQISTTEQQHNQEHEQFQAELSQLKNQQQQLQKFIHTIEFNPSPILETLKKQEQYLEEHHHHQIIIRKNQLASAENTDNQHKQLKQALSTFNRSSNEGRPLMQLFENLEPMGWAKLMLGILLINLVTNLVQPYLPGGIGQTLKLMDSKIFLVWRDHKNTQKFLGVPQKN
jgi:hypothetical protein